MSLFVVNRHGDDWDKNTDEQAKLDQILKKVEKRKKQREKKKEEVEAKNITMQLRQIKRIQKARKITIDVPNNEVVNKTLIRESDDDDEEPKPLKKPKIDPSKIELEGFTVLGTDSFQKKSKVKRVLPRWLANPTVISVNLQNLKTKVSSVKVLDKGLRKLLKENGIKYFFPVQAEVIPWLIEANRKASVLFPRDVCVSAPTGSGKTLAFVLPIIQALKASSVKQIRALVILPTQDLAMQVFNSFKMYSIGTKIDVGLITGKSSFLAEQRLLVEENEAFGFVSRVDILVCTAGRLVDHIKMTKGFNLQFVEFLIIDEADRVLETVQNDWLYHLQKHIHQQEPEARMLNLKSLEKRRPPQKLLFSATLSQDPEKLQKLSLFQPKLFTSIVEGESRENEGVNADTFIGKYTTPKELTEKFIVTSLDLKPLVLFKFIDTRDLRKTLVFTHSVDSAHRLMILLKALFNNRKKIEEISSHLQVKNRKQLIGEFSKGNIDVLICTDSLARGIDLPGVQSVISYSAPKHLKTYIHRAGRTARAGEEGLAVTLLTHSQLSKFKSLLDQAEKTNVEELKIEEDDLEPLVDTYRESLNELKKTVEKEKKTDIIKNKIQKGVVKKKKKTKKDLKN